MSITLRLFTPGDIAQLVPLHVTVDDADRIGLAMTEDEIRAVYAQSNARPEENTLVAEVEDGRIVGTAGLVVHQGLGETMFNVRGFVHPAWRGQGIGSRLLQATIARARQRRDEAGSNCAWLQSDDVPDGDGCRVALFETHGFHVARYMLDMRRELPGVGQPAPIIPLVQEPPGILLKKWRPGMDDEPIGRMFNEAFRDHWGHIEADIGEWLGLIGRGRIQTEHSVVAWDKVHGRLAGACANMCDEHIFRRRGRRELYVEVMGVRREYRRCGAATAMLTWTLHRADHLGMRSVGLDVDAENTTDAVRLYSRLGFNIIAKMRVYRKELD